MYKFSTEKLSRKPGFAKEAILVLCGSFSPITNLHLRLLECVRDEYKLLQPELNIIGGFLSPVCDEYAKKDLALVHHRLQMCQLAVLDSDWISVDEWEAGLCEWTATCQVLQHFHKQLSSNGMPNVAITLVAGSDLLASFTTPGLWADEDLLAITEFPFSLAVVEREATDARELIFRHPFLYKHCANILVVPQHAKNDISSSLVRTLLARQLSIKYLVPSPVVAYLKENKIF